MTFLLVLIVFVVHYHSGTALPMVNSGLKTISTNGLVSSAGDMIGYKSDRKFRLPTVIEQGLSITINGILKTNDESFIVVLHDQNEANEDCTIKFDFKKATLDVTPGILGSKTAPYDLNLLPGVQSKFSLRLLARLVKNGKEVLTMKFQVNEEGPSPLLMCDIKNLKSISYIEMRQGVERIDNLLFDYKETY